MQAVLSFTSTHAAMAAQSLLAKHDIAFLVIPTPKDISLGCGIALLLKETDFDTLMPVLSSSDDITGCTTLYQKNEGGYKEVQSY